jgi:hypothetical protein
MTVRLAAALAALLGTACFTPTWRALPPGGVAEVGSVVLVGRISLVPPLGFAAPPAPGVIVSPADVAHAVALFSADLAEPFDATAASRLPLAQAFTAWVPLDTWFFVEVPRPGPLYLRGVVVPGGVSGTRVEAVARLPLAAGDRVAYVGDVTIVRDRPARLSCRSRPEDARRAAAELGHAALAGAAWQSRIAVPEASRR